jgi:acyl dehydratase
MPFPTSLVGATTEPRTLEVDARATMAYAAGIGDTNPAYLDTTRPGGVVAHPLFPVSPEWPVVLDAGRLAPAVLTSAERRGGLHLTHDLVVHRLVRPGDRLTTTATVRSLAEHRSGTFEVVRLETVDQHGGPVATTDFGMLFRGVAVDADGPPPDPTPDLPSAAPAEPIETVRHALAPTAAHVYTECSRIYNPIHTDPAVAHAAGLPEIVLHGTATLALAISEVVDRHAGGDPMRVRRVQARFGAMVTLPSTIEVAVGAPQALGDDGDVAIGIEVRTEAGEPAVRGGRVTLAAASPG